MPRPLLPRNLWVAALMAAFVGSAPSLALAQDGHHGQSHSESHDWYEKLKQPGSNASCCNGTINGVEGDCRPTRAYQKDDGNWYALLDGRWIQVPPKVVLQQLAPDGRSHICANKTGNIFCFLGGSPKS